MSESTTLARPAAATADDDASAHFDVIVAGAGISGLSALWHFQTQMPGLRVMALEREASFGGTWLTHKFPGIRSDSDLYTFGFHFKPWIGPPIATAAEIQRYLGEMIDENDLARHIRYNHEILSADWHSDTALWTVRARLADGSERVFTANFLYMAQGYYKHRKGFWPNWPNMDQFQGRIVHTEEWDESIDYAGKRVVIIGSGATTATVVPEMAKTAASVTIVQRSPTWFFPAPNVDETADMLRSLDVDETWVHEIVRRKKNFDQDLMNRRCQEEPDAVQAELLGAVAALLPSGFDMKHFTPRYRPWRQRLAFVPEGDMFTAIREGKVGIHTGIIETFTATGLRLEDGTDVPADLIVLATGFDLCILGDIAFTIDGAPLKLGDTVTYRGMMFTGVPNLVWVFGYFRASWTLRADMVSQFACRLLGHMRAHGHAWLTPELRPEDHDMPLSSWIDPEDFNPNYLLRSLHLLPRRGDKRDWMHTQDYWREKDEFPLIDLNGAEFVYRGGRADALAAE